MHFSKYTERAMPSKSVPKSGYPTTSPKSCPNLCLKSNQKKKTAEEKKDAKNVLGGIVPKFQNDAFCRPYEGNTQLNSTPNYICEYEKTLNCAFYAVGRSTNCTTSAERPCSCIPSCACAINNCTHCSTHGCRCTPYTTRTQSVNDCSYCSGHHNCYCHPCHSTTKRNHRIERSCSCTPHKVCVSSVRNTRNGRPCRCTPYHVCTDTSCTKKSTELPCCCTPYTVYRPTVTNCNSYSGHGCYCTQCLACTKTNRTHSTVRPCCCSTYTDCTATNCVNSIKHPCCCPLCRVFTTDTERPNTFVSMATPQIQNSLYDNTTTTTELLGSSHPVSTKTNRVHSSLPTPEINNHLAQCNSMDKLKDTTETTSKMTAKPFMQNGDQNYGHQRKQLCCPSMKYFLYQQIKHKRIKINKNTLQPSQQFIPIYTNITFSNLKTNE